MISRWMEEWIAVHRHLSTCAALLFEFKSQAQVSDLPRQFSKMDVLYEYF